jgi:type II secretory pathway pseudopilin PulG
MRAGERAFPVVHQHGYTYVAVLLWVALVGIGLSITGEMWHTAAKREREQELLFIGHEFRRALHAYYEASPGVKRYPTKLAALLRDERTPAVRRYLRRIYVDPMTGKAEWGLVRQPDGGIVAVHSLSTARPLRTANFTGEDEALAGKRRYADWLFRANGAAPMPGAMAAPSRAQP